MAAPKDFLTGFNHNVRHKGRGFHVQTEDSGEEIAHVITHLFEGGNILASKKTSYAELRGSAELKARVRAIMEEQHRQMLRQLVNGAFDDTAAPLAAEPAGDAAPEAATPDGRTGFLPPVRSAPPPQGPQPPAPAASTPPVAPAADAAPPRRSQPPSAHVRPHVAPVLERSFVPPQRQDRTPGPFPGRESQQTLLWPTADEAARIATPRDGQAPAATPTAPAPAPGRPMGADRTPGPPSWRPVAPIETVFGEEPGTEKSLDEVILRYLAGERD